MHDFVTNAPIHKDWLVDTRKVLKTADGHSVQIWEIAHKPEKAVLSAWAKHLRQHYCGDDEIDVLRRGPGLSRSEYLRKLKLPEKATGFGPATRAGDFGELLIADFLEFILAYWVPRLRYDRKTIRNESTKGCDVIGVRLARPKKFSPNDALIVFECKVQFSGAKAAARLQEAIDHNGKDFERLGESLNAVRQRFHDKKDDEAAEIIERFQDMEDRPYKSEWGAAAIFDADLFDSKEIEKSEADGHPSRNSLQLIVMSGKQMMQLVHLLYETAADEA